MSYSNSFAPCQVAASSDGRMATDRRSGARGATQGGAHEITSFPVINVEIFSFLGFIRESLRLKNL